MLLDSVPRCLVALSPLYNVPLQNNTLPWIAFAHWSGDGGRPNGVGAASSKAARVMSRKTSLGEIAAPYDGRQESGGSQAAYDGELGGYRGCRPLLEPWGDPFVYISRAPRALAGLVSCKSRHQVRSKRCWMFLALAMLAWVGIVQFWYSSEDHFGFILAMEVIIKTANGEFPLGISNATTFGYLYLFPVQGFCDVAGSFAHELAHAVTVTKLTRPSGWRFL
ncbi:hypothetical protein C2E23DRAFT_927064 [Lenzites betulinus]|nr:hypothetical protein C2E23DRAFT_927064 [Lenzites betulinus]